MTMFLIFHIYAFN